MNFGGLFLVLAQSEPVTETVSGNSVMETFIHSNIFNIVLVFVFLVWVLRKTNAFSAITERQNAIKQAIKNSEEEKVRSELNLDSTKKRVRRSDEEVEKIILEAGEVADSLANRIRKDAHLEVEELNHKAQRTIENDKRMASSEVTREVSRAAYIIAEEHVKQAIDERLHKKYINEFIDGLSNLKV